MGVFHLNPKNGILTKISYRGKRFTAHQKTTKEKKTATINMIKSHTDTSQFKP